MGAALELLDEGQIVVITTSDPIRPTDVREAIDNGAQLAKAGFSMVVDGSAVENPSMSAETAREYVAYFRRRPEQSGQRIAYVPPSGLVNYGFSRMLQMLSDEDREIAVFDTRDEALAWLAQPRTPTEGLDGPFRTASAEDPLSR